MLVLQTDARVDRPGKALAVVAHWDPASDRVVISGQPFAEASWPELAAPRWVWDGSELVVGSERAGLTVRPSSGAAGDQAQVRTLPAPSNGPLSYSPLPSFFNDRWLASADQGKLVVQEWWNGGTPHSVPLPREWGQTWGQVLLVDTRYGGPLVLVQYFPRGKSSGLALARFHGGAADWSTVSAPRDGYVSALQWPGAVRIGDLAFVAGSGSVAQLNLSAKAASLYLSPTALAGLTKQAGLADPFDPRSSTNGPVYLGAWNDTLLVAHHLLEWSGDWALWALQQGKVVGTLRMKIGSGQVQLSTGTSSASFALPPGYTSVRILLPQAGTP